MNSDRGNQTACSCRLITKLPQQYRVPETVLASLSKLQEVASLRPPNFAQPCACLLQAVPSEVTRYGLSQVVNSLLELGNLQPVVGTSTSDLFVPDRVLLQTQANPLTSLSGASCSAQTCRLCSRPCRYLR